MPDFAELREKLEEMLKFLPDAVRKAVVAAAIKQIVSNA